MKNVLSALCLLLAGLIVGCSKDDNTTAPTDTTVKPLYANDDRMIPLELGVCWTWETNGDRIKKDTIKQIELINQIIFTFPWISTYDTLNNVKYYITYAGIEGKRGYAVAGNYIYYLEYYHLTTSDELEIYCYPLCPEYYKNINTLKTNYSTYLPSCEEYKWVVTTTDPGRDHLLSFIAKGFGPIRQTTDYSNYKLTKLEKVTIK